MEFKAEVIVQYQQQKQMADAALGRVDDAAFFAHLKEDGDDHTNSIAILVKHISGNFLSRWTGFLTSDGEKADRERARVYARGKRQSFADHGTLGGRLAMPLHCPRIAHRRRLCQNRHHPWRGAQCGQSHPA
jgi:hypothetical protein